MPENFFKITHDKLNCATCEFSDKKYVGKAPCCNLKGSPRVQYPKGCLDHSQLKGDK